MSAETDIQMDADTLQALLALAGQNRATRVRSSGDVTPFDFHVPHRFSPDHLRRLRDFAELTARDLTATLSATLHGAFPITLEAFEEHYVDRQTFPDRGYYIALTVGGRLGGALMLPRETAIGWVTTLLGGLADADVSEDRALSSLENDLLLDISKNVVGAISRTSQDNGGPAIEHTPAVAIDPIELAEEGQIADVCHVTFRRNEGEKSLPFTLVLLSPLLEPIAGLLRPTGRSAEVVQQDMLAHVESVPIPVMVRLGSVNVAMRDMVSLEAGDVIMLPAPISQPIDVIVSGKTIMTGQPVQYQGWNGLQILKVIEDA